MAEMHFIVSLDTKTQRWSIDYEGLDRFENRATIWVPDSSNSSDGEWIKSSVDLTPELKQDNPELYKIIEDYEVATGRLVAMIMMANENASARELWLAEPSNPV